MWKTLGIAPTQDAKEIRRAYAARLRQLGGDPAPAAFQTLRRAYERALAGAAQTAVAVRAPDADGFDGDGSEEAPVDDVRTPDAGGAATFPLLRPLTQPMGVRPQRNSEAALAALNEALTLALSARRYDDAFAVFDRGLASGVLPFHAREPMADGIMDVVMRDPAVSSDVFIACAKRVGWEDLLSSARPASLMRAKAAERLTAELWYQGLVVAASAGQAKRKRPGEPRDIFRAAVLRRRERRIARTLLGRRTWVNVARGTTIDLRAKCAEYSHYAQWLGDRGSPQEIARIERILKRDAVVGPFVRGAVYLTAITIALLILGLVQRAFDVSAGGGILAIFGLRYLVKLYRPAAVRV